MKTLNHLPNPSSSHPRRIVACAIALLILAESNAAMAQGGGAANGKRMNLKTVEGRADAVAKMRTKMKREKDDAERVARAKGWQIRGKDADGSTYKLMRLDPDGRPVYYGTDNANAAISTGASLIRNTAPYNLNGSGFRVGVWDAGSILSTHDEFIGRVTVIDGSTPHDHATHVGGTIGAFGFNVTAQGMAPSVLLDSYDFYDDQPEMMDAAATSVADAAVGKLLISNHSYSARAGWVTNNASGTQGPHWNGTYPERESRTFGQYNITAREWDNICVNAPYYLPFKSAGNERDNAAPAPGTTFHYFSGGWQSKAYDPAVDPYSDGWDNGGFDTVSAYTCAKNVLTVGAVHDFKGAMSSFSGWGPTDDGRIKPDLVANGTAVYSPVDTSNSAYGSMNGTSMATPNAAGSAILLQELFSETYSGNLMRASTLKGLLIQTAVDAGNPGPDYSYGWGHVDVKAAADHILDPDSRPIIEGKLDSGNTFDSYLFTWDGVTPIRATLCWTDPAGTEKTTLDDRTKVLVNDLDLVVELPGVPNTVYEPYVLDVNNPASNATMGDNITDNVEQVYLASPVAGSYYVVVTHKGVLDGGEQHYSLIFNQGIGNLTPTGYAGLSESIVIADNSSSPIDTSPLLSNQNLYVSYAFINSGDRDLIGSYSTEVYRDGEVWHTNSHGPGLSQNATVEESEIFYHDSGTLLLPGTHTITIKLDSGGNLAEGNEFDNEYSKSFEVYPGNDDFANAFTLFSSIQDANFHATEEPGEPNHAGNSGGASVWYKWTAPATGLAVIDTLTSNFDTLLAVYTGSSVGSLSLIASDDDDFASGTEQSKVTFNAIAGTVYRIAVDGYATFPFFPEHGLITLHASVVAPPVITSSTSENGTQGSSFNYQIAATNSPDSYNATGLPAGLSVNTVTGLISGTPTGAGSSFVTVSATNAAGTDNLSVIFSISPGSPVITSALTANGLLDTPFNYQITATIPPNQHYADGLPSGLTVNQSTGLISGTPTVAGVFNVALSVFTGFGSDHETLVLTIVDPTLVLLADPSGPGSLAQIIADVPAGSTVTFDPGLDGGTITLGGSQITINKDLTINASALPGGITISGDVTGDGPTVDDSRVFDIPTGNTVVLDSLTITGGNAPNGGGINNLGDLTIRGCRITGNSTAGSGGGINNVGGTLEIDQSTVSGNEAGAQGGGLRNVRGSLTITNSTISGNTAVGSVGGGISIYGDANDAVTVVTNSTLVGNMSPDPGGGIYQQGNAAPGATLTLRHVTITGNAAGTDGSGSGGGVRNTGANGVASIENSIVAGNTAPSNPNLNGTITETGNNLTSGDPLLGDLADNGGATQTMLPQPGSPAVEAAVLLGGTPATDQRAAARSSGPLPDLGAVELQEILVDTIADESDGIDTNGVSLRDAIDHSVPAEAEIIRFDPGVFPGTVTLGGTELLIDRDLAIDASAIPAPGITVSGDVTGDGNTVDDSRVFAISAGLTVVMDSLTITGGYADLGGGIHNQGNLAIRKSAFHGNHSTLHGGAIFTQSNQLLVENTTISGNTTGANAGAGIWSEGAGGAVTLRHVTVAGNSGFLGGVGVLTDTPATLTLENTIIANNTGGNNDLWSSSIVTALGANIVTSRQGSVSGPPPITSDPQLAPLGSYGGPTQTMPPLADSPAINAGAATALTTDQRDAPRIDAVADIGAVESQSIVRNLVDSGDGSLRNAISWAPSGDTLTFDPTVFTGGAASTITLGGTQLLIDKDLTIDASDLPAPGLTVSGIGTHVVFNVAAGNVVAMRSISITGGLIGIVNHGTASLDGCAIYDNHYTGWGGGAYNEGTLTMTNSTLAENSAQHGGGIFIQNGSVSLTHVTISANEATTWGGGVIQNAGTFEITNTIIAGNTASVGENTYIVNSLVQTGNNLFSSAPLLAPLGNYGGPTPTMPPLPTSPAIEGAVMLAGTPLTDQRGGARPLGPLPDIGALEAGSLFLGTLADTDNDGIPDILEGPTGPYPNLTVGTDDSALDSDGDGDTDATELANMTDPADANDKLKILSFGPAAGFDPVTNPIFDITWTSFPGLEYSLECDADLDFGAPIVLGPVSPDDFTHSTSIELQPGRDFIRLRRE